MNGVPVVGLPNPVRMRFKFQFGELALSDWRPTLVPLEAPVSADPSWPNLESLCAAETLPVHVDGFCFRRADVARFPRGLSRQGVWLSYSPREERLYFVELDSTFDDYLKRRSPKSRQNLKRAVKRFLERTPEALEVATTPEQMAVFHREAVSISRQTYQERLLGAGLPDSPEYLLSMQEKAHRGTARGYLLRDQGKPIAFAWCAARGDVMVYEVIGYLPEHADLSPGTVLLYLILENLFALNQYRLLDFGPGHAFYKEAFATGSLEFADAYLFRSTWHNRWRIWLHWHVERFSSNVGALLDRWGLKKKIRMAMRFLVSSVQRDKSTH